jgi:hypothetical protein
MDKLLELAKKAGLKGQFETALSPQEQKFAELIIKECGTTLLDSQYKIAETDYYDGFNEAVVYSANRIQEFFGFE